MNRIAKIFAGALAGAFALTMVISCKGNQEPKIPENQGDTTAQAYTMPYPKRVLMEQFTSEFCSACPGVDLYLDNIMKEFKDAKVIRVSYHNCYHEDYLTNKDFEVYEMFWGKGETTYNPAVMLDRSCLNGHTVPILNMTKLINNSNPNKGFRLGYFKKQIEQKSPIRFTKKELTKEGDTYHLHVKAEMDPRYPEKSQPLYITVLVVGNHYTVKNAITITGTITEHNHVARKHITSVWGDPIALKGNVLEAEYNFKVNKADLEDSDPTVVFFIHRLDKENLANNFVLQSDEVELPL